MAFNQPEDYRESHKNKGLNYQEGFERIPHRAMMWELEQSALDKIFDSFFPEQRPDYLDFACGTGRILGYLADRARSSTGVDVSQSMLSVARARVPGANIIQCDITRDDPFGDRTFELITAFRFFPLSLGRKSFFGSWTNRIFS